jgi:threonine synthase
VVFAVPSGNLGNLTAGVIAQRLGVPVGRFVAAANLNAVLPDYLRTGTYRTRPALLTLSNAMDVGDPSNFPRLSEIHGEALDALRANIVGIAVSEDETRRTIRETYRESGYLLDPHSAVGVAAARRMRTETGERRPIISLATAHPAKFGDVIREELEVDPELPEPWRNWRTREVRAVDLPDVTYPSFRASLLGMER